MPPKEFLKTKIEFNVNNEMLCFIANITNLQEYTFKHSNRDYSCNVYKFVFCIYFLST